MDDCLFCKIIAGKISSKKVYEDDKVFVFEDINPKAPTHVLIIPKRHVVGLKEATPDDAEIIGYSQLIAAKIARERGIEDGYRTVYNVGPRSGQSVFHLHLHMLGGRDLRIFCAVLNHGNLLWTGDMAQAALNQINHLNIVIGHAVAHKDHPAGLPQHSLRLVPDLRKVRVPVVLQMRRRHQQRP